MTGMQLLNDILLAVAMLAGAAILVALGMVAAAAASKPAQGPDGGIRRDPPPHPQPEPDVDARELVLR